ncbi:MAG: ATP phosphoribosyltransferase [Lentisphaeria bacterium]|nr:ATP phosphoribosyltransferase [Lentisphaeria bacterium]
MLQLAVPNKGSLSESAIKLLSDAGYKCTRSGRELIVSDRENGIDFIFLRPRDIAIYVGKGVLDLGITGRDLMVDSAADVQELLPLGFGRSKFCYAAPVNSGITVDSLNGKRIATSYPELLRQDLVRRNCQAEIVKLDGAVEISIRLGVADAIADVVESGRTLVEAGLGVIGEPMLESEALLISRNGVSDDVREVAILIGRLRGILLARTYAMIEYNIRKQDLAAACAITPGIESPTVSPLNNTDWVAVKAMIRRNESNRIMDELYAIGARGIFVTELRSCRI